MAKPHTLKKRTSTHEEKQHACLSWKGTMGPRKELSLWISLSCRPKDLGISRTMQLWMLGDTASFVKGSSLKYIQDLRNNCQTKVGETNPQRELRLSDTHLYFCTKIENGLTVFETSLISGNSPSPYDNPVTNEMLLKCNAFTLGPSAKSLTESACQCLRVSPSIMHYLS